MLSTIYSRAIDGMAAAEVVVEVHLSPGLPRVTLVGLPEAEVREARERVRAAIQTAHFEFPLNKALTINLAPADLPKEGGCFDLPIALGILAASGQINAQSLDEYEFAGELSLTGALRPVRGALSIALAATQAGKSLILPAQNADEAAIAPNARVFAAHSLLDVCAHLNAHSLLDEHPRPAINAQQNNDQSDMADVKGQLVARRALEVAAAGQHSLLLFGPPGAGKSMLAQRLPALLPPMSEAQALQSAAVLSLAGRFDANHWARRPFRAPHHSASVAAIVGGGANPQPGEISLAHQGVLFLDELPEFDRRVLESLREPLENGHISVSRARQRRIFPARFQLVAAMNPCPCGYHGAGGARCQCTAEKIRRYRSRLSGPFLDRIDIVIEVSAVEHAELAQRTPAESTATMRERIIAARRRQYARAQSEANAALSVAEIERHCIAAPAAQALLSQASERLHLSARGYHRILKVARTIADLAASDHIEASHIAEAIQYRRTLVSD